MKTLHVVTGIRSPGTLENGRSVTHTRYDIDDLSTLPNLAQQWTLYILALEKLQGRPMTERLSYSQLAGIHGYPNQPWQDGGDPTADGYCTHWRPLFLTWHRVYMLLFEEAIVAEALLVAARFGPEWEEQAWKIRIPYWDWAKSPNLPKIATTAEIVLSIPGNSSHKIRNPLYSLELVGDDFKIPQPSFLSSYTETVRAPDRKNDHNPQTVNQALKLLGLRDNVYQTLTGSHKWIFLSNTAVKKAKSLEGIHDGVHRAFAGPRGGQQGHMSWIPTAAFDPIFWLHHTNVDRLYALWQALNPTELFMTRPDHPDTSSTELRPFRARETGEFWTTAMVQQAGLDAPHQSTFDRGYHYPETRPNLSKNKTREEVYQAITQLYGPIRSSPDEEYPPSTMPPGTFDDKLPANLPSLPATAGIRREWFAFFVIKRFIVKGDFNIFFFFGAPPTPDPGEWFSAENVVGLYGSFKGDLDTCADCQIAQEAEGVMYGEVHLTGHLTSMMHGIGEVKLEDEVAVEEWLNDQLTWRVVKTDGTVVSTEGMLAVGVKSAFEAYPPFEEVNDVERDYKLVDVIGITFDWKKHPKATQSQADIGGLTEAVSGLAL